MEIIRHTCDCTRNGDSSVIKYYIYYKIPIFEAVIIYSFHIEDTPFVTYRGWCLKVSSGYTYWSKFTHLHLSTRIMIISI